MATLLAAKALLAAALGVRTLDSPAATAAENGCGWEHAASVPSAAAELAEVSARSVSAATIAWATTAWAS
ncbi:hypothetical protein [Mycolicibacterium fortuitum]